MGDRKGWQAKAEICVFGDQAVQAETAGVAYRNAGLAKV